MMDNDWIMIGLWLDYDRLWLDYDGLWLDYDWIMMDYDWIIIGLWQKTKNSRMKFDASIGYIDWLIG